MEPMREFRGKFGRGFRGIECFREYFKGAEKCENFVENFEAAEVMQKRQKRGIKYSFFFFLFYRHRKHRHVGNERRRFISEKREAGEAGAG